MLSVGDELLENDKVTACYQRMKEHLMFESGNVVTRNALEKLLRKEFTASERYRAIVKLSLDPEVNYEILDYEEGIFDKPKEIYIIGREITARDKYNHLYKVNVDK